MVDRLLGLKPGDFGNTGLTLGMLISVALAEPQRVIPRRHVYGRGGGPETMAAWKLAAVTELLKEHDVDVDSPLTNERPTPMTTDRDNELLRHAHDQLNHWRLTLVYVMKDGTMYVTEEGVFHVEPRYGDVHTQLEQAVDDRDLARGRSSLLTIRDEKGFPVALNPAEIATIRPEVLGPDGNIVQPIKAGWMAHPGEHEEGEQL